ncbi:MAG: hypothetical protein M1823_004681 [Watsoniomyces obsoletus]|nr:MAG: hypothetical protein M1823_004681 [Watsoniomyces obsoletus]
MAHHHQGRYDQKHGTPGVMAMQPLAASATLALSVEEELGADVDEPPDEIGRGQSTPRGARGRTDFFRIAPAQVDRKRSLLSQALAPSPERPSPEPIQPASRTVRLDREVSNASSVGYISSASMADLTSDGGLTSPARTNTPSPPPPEANYVVAWDSLRKGLCRPSLNMRNHEEKVLPVQHAVMPAVTATVQPAPERKRCIKFACENKAPTKVEERNSKEHAPKPEESSTPDPPKRPCALRFACPFKSAESMTKYPTSRPVENARAQSTPIPMMNAAPPTSAAAQSLGAAKVQQENQADRATTRTVPQRTKSTDRVAERARVEASRFHEFASSLEEEDEWMTEDAPPGSRLTVDDTLKKEKTIRAIGEEAEEEAVQEEEEREQVGASDDESDDGEDAQESDNADEDDEDDDDDDDDAVISDDGAESDDEQGFASSDDDDADSQYSFWTMRRSTAATSVEHIGHADPQQHSTEPKPIAGSLVVDGTSPRTSEMKLPMRPQHHQLGINIRSDTPTLPDSTDFVCGTLDEDRPMEEAYASCMAERKRSTHQTIPQDIDPSFPTSDLEDEDEDGDLESDGEARDHSMTKRKLEESSDGSRRSREGRKMSLPKKARMPSPSKRFHSPPPLRRNKLPPRSPPPRRIVDMSPKRTRIPSPAGKRPMLFQNQDSSTNVSPKDHRCHHHQLPSLGRPTLMRIKSLPRAPNPFYQQHRDGEGRNTSPSGRKTRKGVHRRGAIDIVSGLEAKRYRRREKARLKYCQRAAAKCKERKPLPGEGAERMRELGLEMAGKCPGKVGRVQYMISI